MTSKREQLYAITQELRRWLEWQGADDEMGAIPASEEERQKHRERAKARRRAKMEELQSEFRGDEETDESAGEPAAEARTPTTPEKPSDESGEEDEPEAPPEADDNNMLKELGSRRTGGSSSGGSSSTSSDSSDEQTQASGDGGGTSRQRGGGQGSRDGEELKTNAEKLQWLREYMGDCRRCPLWENRTNLVFGEGNPEARLVFVGEAPGYNEDQTGRPFVGRAGKLLNKMIRAMGLERDDVYICNALKSRPPDNRDPQPDEIAECKPFMLKQLDIIEPEVIVTLGRPASQNVLETSRGIGDLRGSWHDHDGTPVMPTYHPAYLLRNESQKRKTWADLQKVIERLGLRGS